MTEPRYEGVALRMGGREWIVPALNLRQLKRLAPRFALLAGAHPRSGGKGVGAGMTEEQIEALIEISHAALSRNYPTLTQEQVSELVDLGNAAPLMRAIVGASGLAPASTHDGTAPYAGERGLVPAFVETEDTPGGTPSASGGAAGEAQAPDRGPGQAPGSEPNGTVPYSANPGQAGGNPSLAQGCRSTASTGTA
jgi:hypothetical protein